MSMTALDVLRGARAYLADRAHWTQNTLADDRGGVCTLGALDRAAGIVRSRSVTSWSPYGPVTCFVPCDTTTQEHSAAWAEAIGLVCRTLGVKSEPLIAFWNDDPFRIHEDILAMLDRAIKLALAEQLEAFVLPSDAPSDPAPEEFPYGIETARSERPTPAVAGATDRRRPGGHDDVRPPVGAAE